MPKIYNTLNQALLKLEADEAKANSNLGNVQDPWDWVAGFQAALHWSWSFSPLFQLRYILSQNQHNEKNLKDALRAFLKNRYQGKHNFTQEPLDLLCMKETVGGMAIPTVGSRRWLRCKRKLSCVSRLI